MESLFFLLLFPSESAAVVSMFPRILPCGIHFVHLCDLLMFLQGQHTHVHLWAGTREMARRHSQGPSSRMPSTSSETGSLIGSEVINYMR